MSKTDSHVVSPDARPVQKSKNMSAVRKAAQPADLRKRLTDLTQAHRQEIQALKSRFQTEQKLMREALKEQQRKTKEAVEASKKVYDSQLKQARADYNDQNEFLRKALKQYLQNAVKEITTNYESRVTKENDERLDELRNMIREDFLKAMQDKQDEIDQIRLQSGDEIASLVQESNEKNHRIAQLESRMKEVSHYLPEDMQEELAQQFGIEAELDTLDESIPKRRGLLARLTSMF